MMVENMDKYSKYRIYGRDNHRQRASFEPSTVIVDDGRSITFICSDVTQTNKYVDVIICGKEVCEMRDLLSGQLLDGFFENCCIGKIEYIGGYNLGKLY